MKKILKTSASILLCVIILLSFAGCKNEANLEGLWENATYTADTIIGSGKTTLIVKVTANENSVVFTLKTDKETVGDALLENNLIEGDESEYGLYVKKVNGIVADYDVDQSYWAFYIDGDYAMTGVDSTEIAEEVEYELVYTK